MARWRTDGAGLRWLEGWGTRRVLCRAAAALGHDLDLFYPLVDAGPYHREMGRCRRCDMVAGWGLVYRGKIAESIAEEPVDVSPWRRLYRGKHRKPIGIMWGPALEHRCQCPKDRD